MLFVVTGGTINKLPVYLADGKTFDNDSNKFGETHLPQMLGQARFMVQACVEIVCMVDGLDMPIIIAKRLVS